MNIQFLIVNCSPTGQERNTGAINLTVYIKADVIRQVFSCLHCLQDSDNKCGDTHWRAANIKGRKSAKLDETGLEIAGQTKMKQ